MKFDKSLVVGVKFYLGKIDTEGISSKDFLDSIQFKFTTDEGIGIEDSTGLFKGQNNMTCKYFDDEEGYMYVHFDKEVTPEEIPFFSEDEMIFKKIEE